MRLADSEAFELLLINYMNNPCISEEAKYVLDVVLNMAKANPTVEGVPVVRCKDCKHAKKISQSWLGPDLYSVSCERLCDEFPVLMNENDYCSRGKRREYNE